MELYWVGEWKEGKSWNNSMKSEGWEFQWARVHGEGARPQLSVRSFPRACVTPQTQENTIWGILSQAAALPTAKAFLKILVLFARFISQTEGEVLIWSSVDECFTPKETPSFSLLCITTLIYLRNVKIWKQSWKKILPKRCPKWRHIKKSRKDKNKHCPKI